MKANTRKRGSTVVSFCLAMAISALLVSSSPMLQHMASAIAEDTGEGGLSVHHKNGKTPDWMIELQSKNARQVPEFVIEPANSYWI